MPNAHQNQVGNPATSESSVQTEVKRSSLFDAVVAIAHAHNAAFMPFEDSESRKNAAFHAMRYALQELVGNHADLGEVDFTCDERAALDNARAALELANAI